MRSASRCQRANSRIPGVDEIAAAREVIEPRRGGGVLAKPRVLGDLAGEHIQPRHQGIGERRLADPGLADEDADLVGQGGFQFIEPFAALAAYQQYLVTELAVGGELTLDTGTGRVIEHVDLVQHDQGRISTSSAATR